MSIGKVRDAVSDNNKLMTGVIILAAGILILLGKWGVFSFIGALFWPLLLLVPGILLHMLYSGRRLSAAALIPGGLLIVYGVLFMIATLWGYRTLHYLWPGFVLGIAAGLFEYHAAENSRPTGVFPVALTLLALSIILFGFTLFTFNFLYLIAVLLIIGGVWLLAIRGRNRSKW